MMTKFTNLHFTLFIIILFIIVLLFLEVNINSRSRYNFSFQVSILFNQSNSRQSKFSGQCGPHQCPEDPACGPDCQVCCQLPYNKNTGQLEVHHLFTGRGLWNEEERFRNLNLAPGTTILYPGANTDGADGFSLMKLCPQW